MGLATFIGGIHPYEGKELSESKPLSFTFFSLLVKIITVLPRSEEHTSELQSPS